MSDSYVCSGATMRCTMGDRQAKLTVLPDRTVFLCGKPMANISDHKSMVNLAPFGKCRSLGYPATAAATAAHHGRLTPMPCVHNTPMPWMQGKTDYYDKSQHSLLRSCKLQCLWGGVISFLDDGQTGESSQYVTKNSKSSIDEIQAESNERNGLTPESILDGIQLVLDVAGLAPGVGAFADLTNAAIYAFRGDMLNAGLSLFAAIPGVGDAATATKLVGKGIKMAKSTEKVVGTGVETGKAFDKALPSFSHAEKATANGVPRKFGELTHLSDTHNSKMIQKAPFGELTQKTVSAEASTASGQGAKLGELTRRTQESSLNVSSSQSRLGELTQKAHESGSDLSMKLPKLGELTQKSHIDRLGQQTKDVSVNSKPKIPEGAAGVMAYAKPINANTAEELQRTMDVLKKDELSRRFNKYLDYNA